MEIEVIDQKIFGDIAFILSELGDQYVCYAHSIGNPSSQAALLPYEIGAAVFPRMRRPYEETPHNGTKTSKQAAQGNFTSIRDKIYFYIGTHVDVTTEEVEKNLDLKHQTASARISELWREGKIERTGVRRNSTGSSQFTYSVV